MLSNFAKLIVCGFLALYTNVLAAPSTHTTGDLAHRAYTPTRVEARGGAGNPAPSQGGSTSGKKCIKVTKKIGGTILTLGFVGGSLSHKGTLKITPWRWECLEVIVPSTAGHFDLSIKGQNESKRFLGLAGDDTKSALSLVRTAQTAPKSPPQGVGNTADNFALSESAVWLNNGGRLTADWTSKTGVTIPAKSFHWLGNPDNLYFVTKPGAFSSDYFGAYEVTLELVNP